MAATVGVCLVASRMGSVNINNTEMGMHSSPMMRIARCQMCPTIAYFFAPNACTQ